MSKFVTALSAVMNALTVWFKEYPAALSFVLSTAVALGAHYGFNLDPGMLTAIWVGINGFLLAYTHSTVTPMARVDKEKAAVEPAAKE